MGRVTQPFSMWRITDFRHKSAIRHRQLNEMAVCVYCEHAKFLLRLFCRLNHGPDMSACRASVRRELIPPYRSEPTHDRAKDAGLPRIRARREPDTTIQRMAETRVGRDKKISFGTEFLQTVERGLHRWRSSRRYGCRGSFPSQRRARKNPSHSAYRYRGVRGAEAGRM